MSFLTLWLLVLILERSIASKHRSINLALETVLQFDKADDINVIKKVQNFLSRIQGLIDKKLKVSDTVITRRKKKYELTDFVEDLVTTLNFFEDNDLKQVFLIVDKDFRSRRVNNDLIDDNVRRFLSLKLTEIRRQSASGIRRNLDKILKELRADKNQKNSYILDFVNSLYKGDSDRKLSKLIKRLNLFLRSARKSKVVLKDIIEKVINEVIYEHYNNLEDSEKGYIKMMVKAYLTDEKPTVKQQKIKQRTETEITPESINTNESKPIRQVTELQLTPKTFKDVPKEITKQKYTHITLYPKSIQLKKIPTGISTEAITESTPSNEEESIDRKNEKTKDTHEIFSNQSVEINVNLLFENSRDSKNREDSQMVESFRSKSTFNKVFQRASEKSKKHKKHHKSSSPTLSIETFGSLYRKKTHKRYNNKKKSRIVTHKGRSTMKDRFKTTYINDIVDEKSVEKEIHFVGDRRRFNKPTILIKEKASEADIKDIVKTTKQHSLTTRALVSLTISTNKVTTPEVTTEISTTKTTQNVKLNEILKNEFSNENVIDSKEVTKTPLVKSVTTTTEFVPKSNITPYEIELNNHIMNETTVSDEPTIAFNVDNYVKNSEVLNLEDDKKKKLIEEKMRADFGDLLNPTTNATTEGITDIFKELEDAFEI